MCLHVCVCELRKCEDGWTGLNGQPAVRGDTSGDMYCPNLVGEDKDLRTLALLACLLAIQNYTAYLLSENKQARQKGMVAMGGNGSHIMKRPIKRNGGNGRATGGNGRGNGGNGKQQQH